MPREHTKKSKASDPLKELLWPGQSVELLKALHIVTREGALNADSRRKLKQVLHLVQLLRPSIERLFEDGAAPRLADLGAGAISGSYSTMIFGRGAAKRLRSGAQR
jgi:hypothetical protein